MLYEYILISNIFKYNFNFLVREIGGQSIPHKKISDSNMPTKNERMEYYTPIYLLKLGSLVSFAVFLVLLMDGFEFTTAVEEKVEVQATKKASASTNSRANKRKKTKDDSESEEEDDEDESGDDENGEIEEAKGRRGHKPSNRGRGRGGKKAAPEAKPSGRGRGRPKKTESPAQKAGRSGGRGGKRGRPRK